MWSRKLTTASKGGARDMQRENDAETHSLLLIIQSKSSGATGYNFELRHVMYDTFQQPPENIDISENRQDNYERSPRKLDPVIRVIFQLNTPHGTADKKKKPYFDARRT